MLLGSTQVVSTSSIHIQLRICNILTKALFLFFSFFFFFFYASFIIIMKTVVGSSSTSKLGLIDKENTINAVGGSGGNNEAYIANLTERATSPIRLFKFQPANTCEFFLSILITCEFSQSTLVERTLESPTQCSRFYSLCFFLD